MCTLGDGGGAQYTGYVLASRAGDTWIKRAHAGRGPDENAPGARVDLVTRAVRGRAQGREAIAAAIPGFCHPSGW
jgi:hypothetical protein